jgi:hypothetical protein
MIFIFTRKHHPEWMRDVPILLDDTFMEGNDTRKHHHHRLRTKTEQGFHSEYHTRHPFPPGLGVAHHPRWIALVPL